MWWQVGCKQNWVIKRFMTADLQKYYRVSSTQLEHAGHGPDAEHPVHQRRGYLSQRVHELMAELLAQGSACSVSCRE